MTVEQMIAGYKQGHSLRRISADAGLSYQKCRKILITAGVYSSPKADRINELAAAGLTKDQISEQLKIKPETVEAYLGYKKGAYNSDEPTVNALRIRKCREKNVPGRGNMATVVKDRVCRECGKIFPGGPRAWYCPECRETRRRESERKYRAKGRKADRPLGSTDNCVRCGKEYVVKSARQKYCPDCAYEAVREVDRPMSRAWNQAHKETLYPAKNAKRRKSSKP